jgi:hypothetical protein
MELSATEKRINDFILRKPQDVVAYLRESKISLPYRPTLDEIVEKVYVQLIVKQDKKFAEGLDDLIANDGYKGLIDPISLTLIAISVAGVAKQGISASQKRKVESRIALNQADISAKLSKEELELKQKTEREKIIADSVTNYAANLQTAGAEQRKTAIYVMIGSAVGLAILYGVSKIIK